MAVGTGLDTTDTRGSSRSQRVRLTLLLVAIGIATVVVPPLILGRKSAGPPSSPASAGPAAPAVAESGRPATALASGVPLPPPSSAPASPSRSAGSRPFVPISVQAEDPRNTLVGGAQVVDCPTCDGGARVRYIGADNKLVVIAAVPADGSRVITVVYECDGTRTVQVTVDGGNPIVTDVTGTSWTEPRTVQLTTPVAAGEVRIMFSNSGPAPDIDKVTLS